MDALVEAILVKGSTDFNRKLAASLGGIHGMGWIPKSKLPLEKNSKDTEADRTSQ